MTSQLFCGLSKAGEAHSEGNMLRDRLGSDQAKSRDRAGPVESWVGPEASYVRVQSTIQEVSELEEAGFVWNSKSAAHIGGSLQLHGPGWG